MAYPEENLARRLVAKYQLRPPIDIFALGRRYAHLEVVSIPVDVDGVSLDLKIVGRRPRILINKNRPETRMRFTLAHEIGHVLIPWHIGTILDETVLDKDQADDYWSLEAEANRFASELLMPSEWVTELIEGEQDPTRMTERIAHGAEVSWNAATIKLIGRLPAGYIYVQLDDDDVVVSSGRSYGTFASAPNWGETIDLQRLFIDGVTRWDAAIGPTRYVWWNFALRVEVPKITDQREWREILGEIVNDLSLSNTDARKLKQSLNGVIAYANGSVKGKHRSAESIYAACLQRLQSNRAFASLLRHPSFSNFLAKRIDDLLDKQRP